MQLYFIRHAQSENNILLNELVSDFNDLEGRRSYARKRFADAELTAVGLKQAKALGKFIGKKSRLSFEKPDHHLNINMDEFRVTHLYVSPMIRALDTALPVAEALDLSPVVWEDLHEQGGIWEEDDASGKRAGLPGANAEFLKEKYPRFVLPASFSETGWWNRPYEEPDACFQRAGRVLNELLEKHIDTADRAAVVSHSFFYNCLMYQIFGLTNRDISLRFAINNASITRIEFIAGIKRLVYQNRVDFLPDRLFT